MPYISTESIKEKRNLIKKSFPKFKFSVTRNHYSVINVKVLSGPIDLIPDSKDGYEQVNQFYIKEHYEDLPKTSKFLSEIYEIANNSNQIESYDGDYGSIPSFYTHISIGSWDKPYKVTNN